MTSCQLVSSAPSSSIFVRRDRTVLVQHHCRCSSELGLLPNAAVRTMKFTRWENWIETSAKLENVDEKRESVDDMSSLVTLSTRHTARSHWYLFNEFNQITCRSIIDSSCRFQHILFIFSRDSLPLFSRSLSNYLCKLKILFRLIRYRRRNLV